MRAWLRDGMLAFVCGCASTTDGSHAVTAPMDAGIQVDAGMIDTASPPDVPPPCTAPMMTCGMVAAPRPIAPLSTATTTSQQPTLHWQLATGTDGAIVQICHDRPCTIVEQTLTATGSSIAPATSLAPGVHFWRLFGRSGATTGTIAGPTWEFFVGHRSAPVDTSWGSVLDVNGDGYADVAVTGSRQASNATSLYLGSARGLGTIPITLSDCCGVASAGDVNGDGYADLLVRADLYLGSSNGLSTASPVLTDLYLSSIAGVGDVNGDGYADVMSDNEFGSVVYLFLGSASGLGSPISLATLATDGEFPLRVAGAGDINGDGFADVVVGALSENTGNAYVFLGSANGPSAMFTVLSHPAGSHDFAAVVAGAGDVNGDGYSDVVVGNANDTVFVYAGSASGLSAVPMMLTRSDASFFGEALANAGDVNGDGYSDLIVGAPWVLDPSAYVYLGGASGLTNSIVLTDNGAMGDQQGFGSAVSGAGDVNGDGYTDIVVGDCSEQPGTVNVYLGRAIGLNTTAIVLTSPAGVEDFGRFVALGW